MAFVKLQGVFLQLDKILLSRTAEPVPVESGRTWMVSPPSTGSGYGLPHTSVILLSSKNFPASRPAILRSEQIQSQPVYRLITMGR